MAIDTATCGAKSFTVSASDAAGNTTTKTVAYSVPFVSVGIEQPVNRDDSSVFKLGSTVPLKFSLYDAKGLAVGSVQPRLTLAKLSNKATGKVLEAADTSAPSTGSLFRYLGGGKYIFNLGSKGLSVGTWEARIAIGVGRRSSFASR